LVCLFIRLLNYCNNCNQLVCITIGLLIYWFAYLFVCLFVCLLICLLNYSFSY
jgi:hypothetical protein